MKQRTSFLRTATALALGLAMLFAFGLEPDVAAQDSDKSTPSPKIDSALAQVLQMAQGNGVSAQGIRAEANQVGVPIEGNAVTVVVEVSRNVGGIITAISQIMGGQFVQAQSQSLLRLRIPLDAGPLNALLRLADLSGIAYIRPPLAPQALVTSQGVALTGADQLQSQGTRGQNTTIGVIDLGFAGLSTAQSRGEIPGNVQTFDFSGSGLQSSSSHGTAVAEIVHDMAPGADLVLMKISDEVDLENAIDRAIQMGVDVINHSVAWFNTNFYDGTGIINDAVRRARNAGILWVNAAGNYGQRHWQGVADDRNGNNWVEFTSGREGLDFSAQAGQLIEVYLTWRDWPSTRQDYDLFVTNSFGSIVASSERVQNGSQPPTEHLLFSAPSAGNYEIRVRPASVGSPKQLAIFNLNQDISPFVKQGSIVTPGDCSCALAVGAVEHPNWTTGPIAPFSSQGPTPDGRIKPDLVGPAGVRVSTSQWNPFAGTSAAAPHVAGAAALLLSEDANQSASDLERALQSQAISMGASTQFGSGRLALTPSTPSRADLTIRNADVSPRTPRVGQNVTVSAEVVNQGSARAGSFNVELSDNSGTRTQSIAGLSPGATATINFTRTINSTSTDVRLTVDPFDQVNESNENNNSTTLNITAQSQQPSLEVNVSTDRSSYNVGDEIRVQFNTNRDGHVYLYNVDAQGRVQILYPSSESGNAFLRAGSYDLTRLLGVGQLTVVEPRGTEDIHAVLASRSINLGLSGAQSSSYDDPNTFRSVLANRINNQFPTPDWAWDVASFQVGSSQPSNRAPNAQFSFSPSQPFVNDVVTFDGTNSSDPDGRIVDWNWTFEAGNRVETRGSRVNVRFTSPGPVNVTLTVTDNQGGTDSTTRQINVRQQAQQRPPSASFSVNPPNPQINQTVTFDGRNSRDADGVINAYRWDFDGNGTTDATGPRVQTSYNRSGTFRVTLTVIDNDGLSDSTTQTVRVSSPQQRPTARFSFTPNNPQPNQTVTFDGRNSSDPDGAINAYRWDLNGDGLTDATGARVQTTYNRSGSFQATLTVVDNDGLSDATTQTVQVSAPRQGPAARFSFSPSNPNVNQTVTFDGRNSSDPDGRVANYRWDLDGDGRADTTGPTAQARYTRAGTFQVTLTVTDNDGLSDSTTRQITVGASQPPDPPSTPDDYGIYITSTSATAFTVTFRGKENWTEWHEYRILLLTFPLDRFGDIEVSTDGQARSDSVDENRRQPVLLGRLKDGSVTYNVEARGPQRIMVSATLDLDGDGERDVPDRSELPVYVGIDGEFIRVSPPRSNPEVWLQSRGSGSVLPFEAGNVVACGEVQALCEPVE